MTKEELLAVKRHTRIKYVGKDQKVLDQIKKDGPATALNKGLVVYRIYDYATSGWNKEAGLTISPYSNKEFNNVEPADWVLVDAKRIDLARKQEKRNVEWARLRVKQHLERFASTFDSMKYTKDSIDRTLNDIPLSDRMNILQGLTDDQKAWLQLISYDAEHIKSVLKKIAEDPDAMVVSSEDVNGSEGSDVPVPAETAVLTDVLRDIQQAGLGS